MVIPETRSLTQPYHNIIKQIGDLDYSKFPTHSIAGIGLKDELVKTTLDFMARDIKNANA